MARLQNKTAQHALRVKEGEQKVAGPSNARGELKELRNKVEKVTKLLQKKRIISEAPEVQG